MSRNAWLRGAAAVFAVALLAVAAVVVSRAEVWQDLEPPSAQTAVLLAGLLASTALVVVCSAILFRCLLARAGASSSAEMLALIAASALLNYLPLSAGLVGRIVYHRRVHRMSYTVLVCSLIGARALSLMAVGLGAAGVTPWALVLMPPGIAAAWAAGHWGPIPAGAFVAALPARLAEFGLWAVRYAIAFELLGHEGATSAAIASAGVSMLAQSTPLIPGAIGVREWSVGLVAPLVDGGLTLSLALAADLINRAADILVAGVMGGPALRWVVRRYRAAGKTESE